MKNEAWKAIPEYSIYQISTFGRVKNTKTNNILTPTKPYNGYLQVHLCQNGKKISKCIHQLMGVAFLGPRPKGFEINHIDGNRENNYLNNLEFIPWKENRRKRISPLKYCVICNKQLDWNKTKTCSSKCHFECYWVELECETCGKKFFIRKSELKAKTEKRRYSKDHHSYCSHQCYSDSIDHSLRKYWKKQKNC